MKALKLMLPVCKILSRAMIVNRVSSVPINTINYGKNKQANKLTMIRFVLLELIHVMMPE